MTLRVVMYGLVPFRIASIIKSKHKRGRFSTPPRLRGLSLTGDPSPKIKASRTLEDEPPGDCIDGIITARNENLAGTVGVRAIVPSRYQPSRPAVVRLQGVTAESNFETNNSAGSSLDQ